jgi:hypothetical protein
MERDATVPGTVVVTALETSPEVAQQESARVQERGASIGPICEQAGHHRRDRDVFMALFERSISRPCGADVLTDAPILAVTKGASDRHSATSIGLIDDINNVFVSSHGTHHIRPTILIF